LSYQVDCFRQTHNEKSAIVPLLEELQSNGLIKTVGDSESFTRVVQNENKVKVVKQMPKIVQAKQPTIAIITAQYCEKLAVDAMMEDQETFVRYTTVGTKRSLFHHLNKTYPSLILIVLN